jgi:hypothetical protein
MDGTERSPPFERFPTVLPLPYTGQSLALALSGAFAYFDDEALVAIIAVLTSVYPQFTVIMLLLTVLGLAPFFPCIGLHQQMQAARDRYRASSIGRRSGLAKSPRSRSRPLPGPWARTFIRGRRMASRLRSGGGRPEGRCHASLDVRPLGRHSVARQHVRPTISLGRHRGGLRGMEPVCAIVWRSFG